MKNQIQINQNNFESEVLQSAQPVLVDFWAEWCGPCKILARALDQIADEQAGRAKIGKVNVDENPDLVGRFGIKAVPTLLYFVDGQLRYQTVGAASKERIVGDLEALGVAV